MAERLPVGAARNTSKLLPSFASFSTTSASSDISAAVLEQMNNLLTSCEPDTNGSSELNTNGSNGPVLCNGLSSIIHHRDKVGHVEVVKNGGKVTETEPNHESEWVEQDEPGVYITLTSLIGGVKELKRVRFSRKRFSEKQAEQWWAGNRERVYKQYNVRMVDNKSNAGIGNL